MKTLFVLICILFYGASLFALSWGFEGVVNSPDEAANLFFADQFAQDGSFAVAQPLYERSFGLLHPRSMVTFAGSLLPGSFLGLPVLAGSLQAIFGDGAQFLLTPILLILALLAWRGTVYHLFGNARLANLAVFFLAIHPGFWYYGMRSMMHNAAFVALLLIALWFLVAKPLQTHIHWRDIDPIVGGGLIGLALFFRGSEILWVLGALVAALIVLFMQKRVTWRVITSIAIGLFLGLIPSLFFNTTTYGDPFTTGYTATESVFEVTSAAAVTAGAEVESRSLVASILFPFGFHERVLLRNTWRYIFALYPWISFFSIIGFFWWVADKKERKKKEWRLFTALALGVSAWLILMYGSWVVHDNPDPNAVTLANSYVRYWLPIFVFGSVFAAYAIEKFWADKSWYRSLVISCILLFSLGLSVNLIWFGIDGVLDTRQALQSYEEKRAEVLSLTEDNAIIVVDYADKYIFPHRDVVVPLRSETTYSHLPALREIAPLYYYGLTLPEEDLLYLQEEKLSSYGLMIEPVQEIMNETLYRIEFPR
jgi:hypothetical protein